MQNGGVFLKKFFAIFTALSILFLSSCVQKDLVDIYLFSERFSKHCQNFKIDTGNLVATEETDVLKIPFTFNDKFLLTVNADKETFLVTSFSLTYMHNRNKNLTDKDFSSFVNIAECATKAFTKLENTDEIFNSLSLKNKSDVLKINHTSFEKGFYKYTFVSDEIGFYFTASTERR